MRGCHPAVTRSTSTHTADALETPTAPDDPRQRVRDTKSGDGVAASGARQGAGESFSQGLKIPKGLDPFHASMNSMGISPTHTMMGE
jgi:hypothetical protein